MRRLTALALGAAVLVAGCDWKADGAARLEELYPTTPPPPPPASCAELERQDGEPSGREVDVGEAACTGLMQGRWAVRLTQRGTIAPLGEDWAINITDLFVAELSADKSALELRFCDQVAQIITGTGQIDLGETRVPPKLQGILHERPVSVPLPGDGSLHAEDVVWLWGLTPLGNPVADPLPTDPADRRVVDEDGDGNPGVTMSIVTPQGDRYMVRRAVWTFAPSRLSSDGNWLRGDLDFVVNEEALGASNPLLTTVAPITSRADCNGYQLRCVGPSYGCAELKADYLDLFAAAPE